MKKAILYIIIISLIFVIIFQSVLSANAIFINDDKSKLQENNYKDYWNCTIKAKEGIEGKAFLFPGFFSSWPGSDSAGVDVKRAFGILIRDNEPCPLYGIYFNNDYYYANWTKAYVFSFTGYFYNYFDGPWRIFEINGTAKFVRIYNT
jgi:hypothetical protein